MTDPEVTPLRTQSIGLPVKRNTQVGVQARGSLSSLQLIQCAGAAMAGLQCADLGQHQSLFLTVPCAGVAVLGHRGCGDLGVGCFSTNTIGNFARMCLQVDLARPRAGWQQGSGTVISVFPHYPPKQAHHPTRRLSCIMTRLVLSVNSFRVGTTYFARPALQEDHTHITVVGVAHLVVCVQLAPHKESCTNQTAVQSLLSHYDNLCLRSAAPGTRRQ